MKKKKFLLKILFIFLIIILFYTAISKKEFAVSVTNIDSKKIKVTTSSSNNSNKNNINSDDILEEQKENLGISEFIDNSNKYTEDINISDIFKSSLSGNFDNNQLLKIILNLAGKNLKEAFLGISGIIVVIIINSILKSISENLGNESVSKIAFYIQYILVVTMIMTNFSNIINEIKISIQELTAFSNTLIPLMGTLMIATGNITSSGIIEPILLLIVTFIGNFVTNILIPLILGSTAIGIVSKISTQVQLERMSKFMKKGSVWILTTILGIFITIASLEGGLTSNVDVVTKRAGKSVISAAVPVVGSVLSDAIDTISGYSNIIKNSTGIIGIIVVASICLKPILNLTAFTITYYIGSALAEPIADKKIVSLIESMAGTFKILLGVMFAITAAIIIGLGIVMKITT